VTGSARRPRPALGGSPGLRLVADGELPELDAFLAEVVATGRPVANVQRAIGHHPPFARAFAEFSTTVRSVDGLTEAEVELVILRVAVRTGCPYPFAHHVARALASGVTEAQVAALWGPPEADAFGPEQRTLLRAVDEVELDAGLSDEGGRRLAQRLTEAQLVGFVAFVGFYGMLARLANSAGVPVDAAVRPALDRFWPGPA
jgi:AhpD family alkylhydroperoxidase